MHTSIKNDDIKYNILEVVKIIHGECKDNGENWRSKLKSYLDDEIPNIIDEIVWLNETNVDHLQPYQLVRFRGMVQDMYDPELYMETFIVQKADGSEVEMPGKYMDVASCGFGEEILIDSPNCKISDRENYCCISVPGESEWVKEAYVRQNSNCIRNSPEKSYCVSNKRSRPEEIDCDSTSEKEMEHNQSGENKKLKEVDPKSSVPLSMSSNISASKESKFPFGQSDGTVCMLKIYDKNDDVRLNDIVEVVGILAMDVPQVCQDSESLAENVEGTLLPPSLAPRLHVISMTKRSHYNPSLPLSIDRSKLSNYSSNLRELIQPVLRVALLGDELAADYLTCHLISSVLCRQDVVPIGKYTLNLSGITPELSNQNFPRQLFEFLQNLTTLCYFLSMTLDNMNKLKFIPKKDYQENCLKSGLLQLPSNLHLVVDETQLSAGQLDTDGLKNLTALSTLVRWQKVDYDFQYHTIEQHTNIPVLILSEGRAMIASDFQVKLEPSHSNVNLAFSQVSEMLSDQLLEQIRIHLTLARLMPYDLTENMQKMVQDDFVSSRQHSDGLTAEGLHSLLTLARLLAQSSGKMELTEEVWKRAKSYESQRKGRLEIN